MSQPQEFVEVYVELLGEGTFVLRPTTALLLPDGKYKLMPTDDYDPELERWAIQPESIVILTESTRDGSVILVAQVAD